MATTESTATEALGERLGQLRTEVESTERRTRTFVRRYPLGSLLAAIVAGYMVARLASRV